MNSARPSWSVKLAGAAGALVGATQSATYWGFTVDDALIPARYAANLRAGLGYRFNALGPVTDGVTPLGFPFALAPFAGQGPLPALVAAKALGLVAWSLASAALFATVAATAGPRRRWSALTLVALSAPVAAWSVAGLETGVVTALAAFAACARALGRHRAGAACAGLAAAMRPELVIFAAVLSGPPIADLAGERAAVPRAGSHAPAFRAAAERLALALGPAAGVALARVTAFGRPTPLSAVAKPPDLGLGATYALACALLTGAFVLVAPFALRRATGATRVLAAAVVAHFAAIAAAGGDWMPLSRLAVPALPALALAAAGVAAVSHLGAWTARLVLAVGALAFVHARVGPAARRVMADREATRVELAPALAGARSIASLDVGWVGAAVDPRATVVDLAGVTDPAIATLPGGHTSKRLPARLLDARGVDAVVLLCASAEACPTVEAEPEPEPAAASPDLDAREAAWREARFSRAVEARLAWVPHFADEFRVAARSSNAALPYVVLRRRAATPPAR